MATPAVIKVLVEADTSKASSSLKGVGESAKGFGSSFKSTFGAILASGAVTQVASKVAEFGKQSIEAYRGAQETAVEYHHALEQIPGITEKSAAALENQAKALGKVTVYGAGATKSGQAVLANFHLTATQIQTLTPLMQDYATRTGKDIPTAATDLGKAMMGQGRALKNIGIDFKVTTAGAKAAGVAQKAFARDTEAVTRAQDHLTVVQAEVAKGQLTGKAAAHALTAAHASLAEKTMAAERAHTVLNATQKDAGKTTDTFSRLTAALTEKVGGLSTAMGDTSAGKMQIMNNQVKALKVSVGEQLVPALTKATDIGLKFVDFVQKNSDWLLPLALGIGAVVAALKLWEIAQAALNLLMDTNPLVLVVVALAALGVALFAAYKHVKGFRDVVDAVWHAVRDAFTAMWTAVKGTIDIIVRAIVAYGKTIFLPFTVAIGALKALFTGGFSGLLNYVKGIPGQIGKALAGLDKALGNPFQKAFDFVKGIIQGMVDWVGDKFGSIKKVVGDAIGVVKHLWNDFAGVWNSVHLSVKVPDNPVTKALKLAGHGFDFGLPQLPRLARGGYVNAPTLALVGESGPEAVVPLSRGAGFGQTINITMNVPEISNPADTGRAVIRVIRAYERSNTAAWRAG